MIFWLLLLMSAPAGAQLREYLDKAARDGEIPGVVVVVQKNGETVFSHAAGLADRETKRVMKLDDIFMIASTSKPLAATAILTLVDEGKLRLDDRISKYFPEFAGTSTVRQALSHTSGIFGNLPDHPRLKSIRDFSLPLQTAVERILAEPLVYEPGTKYIYGGASFCVAGRIAEKITGKEFDDFANEKVFAPAGMRRTVYRTKEDWSARIPTIYRKTGDGWAPQPAVMDGTRRRGPRADGFVLVPGGIYSTAEDLLRFGNVHRNGGKAGGKRILSEAMVREMHTKQTGELKENYGLGWQLLAGGAYGHGGAYGTYLGLIPERGIVAVILTQTTGATAFLDQVKKLIASSY